jgi:hypothetical protein
MYEMFTESTLGTEDSGLSHASVSVLRNIALLWYDGLVFCITAKNGPIFYQIVHVGIGIYIVWFYLKLCILAQRVCIYVHVHM